MDIMSKGLMYSTTQVELKYSISDAMSLKLHHIISSRSTKPFAFCLRTVPRTRHQGYVGLRGIRRVSDSL